MALAVVLLVILAVVILWGIATYNRFVQSRNEIDNSWAQIDVQLKRRYDLIPNLVETVKGYAKHERGTLEAVIQARNAAIAAKDVTEKAQAENVLSGALRQLFALSEAYPDLKANQNFLALQEELTSTENKIAFARQYFNDRVLAYNTGIQVFPANIIAGQFGFSKRDLFELKDEAERAAPHVSF